MNFKTYLEEGRDAPLYHVTGVHKANQIIEDNILKAETNQYIEYVKGNSIKTAGVSLTRDINFAKEFKTAFTAIFELDQRLIAQRHKIVPYDWNMRNYIWSKYKRERKTEYEEFVIGSIKDIKKYITKIHVNAKVAQILTRDRSKYTSISMSRLLWDRENKKWVNKEETND